MFFAWLADKTRKRALFIAVQALLTATGLVLMAYARQNRVRYFGTVLLFISLVKARPG
jgi:hypothetical protein